SDVEHPARVSVERGHGCAGNIFDVDVVAALRTVAEDPACRPVAKPPEKDRHDACFPMRILVWPVDVAEPQRDVRRVVEAPECAEISLARKLCRAVRRERTE